MSVDVPDPPDVSVTLVGLSDAVRPEGDADEERATVPAKPYRLPRFILELAEDPDGKVTVVWLADKVKSGGGVTVTVTVVVCVNEPLVAVTTTA